MSKAHIGSELPLSKYCIPIDYQNTAALFHYDISLSDINGIAPVGSTVATLRRNEGVYGGCVAIEDATRNILYNVDFEGALAPNYSVRGSVYTLSIDTLNKYNNMNSLKIVGTGAGATGADIQMNTTIPAIVDTEYVFSFYAKALESTVLTGRWGYGNGSSSVTIGTQWAKYSMVIKTGTQIYVGILPFFDRATTVWINSPQLEQKSFATSFVNGSRSTGFLSIPNPITTEDFTLNFWCKITSPIGTPISYATILSMGSYYSNNSFTIMDSNGTDVGGVQRLIRKGNTGEWGWSSGDFTKASNYNDWNMYTVTKDSTNYKLYSNGVYIGSIAHLSTSMQDTIYIGSRNSSGSLANSLFDELRIDKVARTPQEIMAWYVSGAPFFPRGIQRIAY